MSEDFNLKGYINFWADKVGEFLQEYVQTKEIFASGLVKSMKYSLFAGGKRMRPAIIYSSYGIFDSYFDKITPYAAAVEMLHTYSLVHDDLPAMDDDDFRRGKPTNHKVFGEATAILAGDALLTKAFETMLDKELNPEVEDKLMVEAAFKLSKATGDAGMVAGQYADMEAESGGFDDSIVDFIHENKTAALLGYCSELGAILGYGEDIDKANMKEYGRKLGLAFQIVDDVLDVTGTTEQLGKDAGSDLEKGKATYVTIYGVDKSKQIAREMIDEAISIVKPYGKASRPCEEIAKYVLERTH
ncbi:polyprenyl synthetase family protein [Limisalsivibrio acetivorans]|uniref:polyprenyl synthetase family protein n=1 Tax=Limisalsivibrio acetivorans TaxID=1304888 RepID=UPI0003B2F4F4|nr:farnesyl diphosphate synthase [Limisalsivibrio acetivorans]